MGEHGLRDPQGRLTVGRESKGLLRLTLPKSDKERIRVEVVDDSLLECRGLLYAFGSKAITTSPAIAAALKSIICQKRRHALVGGASGDLLTGKFNEPVIQPTKAKIAKTIK